MDYASLVLVTGVIMSVSRGQNCCSREAAVRTENGMIHLVISPETLVIDQQPLRPGMRVAAYYDGNLPAPLIYPPKYQAWLVTRIGREEQVMLNEFDRNLTALDGSLELNIGRETKMQTINGQPFNCTPGNRALLVYYTNTTRSMPPKTTPKRIIVIC
jgi:hypothetical protein